MKRPETAPRWYLFDIPVDVLLEFIEKKTGKPFPDAPEFDSEANRWHLALRKGMRNHLHLDLGLEGVDEPSDPVVEGHSALHAALLLGRNQIPVILSGEWQRAVEAGLISQAELERHETELHASMTLEEA
jgi:hypothetical protein